MLHRLPDRPEVIPDADDKPAKFIILIAASTSVAGKVQIARTVSAALSCPLFQGDSLHETADKAANVGASKHASGADASGSMFASGANQDRYRRMWLSKITRTGLLFPEESRAAIAGFSGFGGVSSTSTSRRGSASSNASEASLSDTSSFASSVAPASVPRHANRPPASIYQAGSDSVRIATPALLVLTHPSLEDWHQRCIREAVREYSIGVIFVSLDEDDEPDLPVLKPLDPRIVTSFGCFDDLRAKQRVATRHWGESIALKVDVQIAVDDIAQEIVEGARAIMDE